MTDERLTELEIKISHQEMAIETLQQLSYQQQKTIERMEAEMKRLCKHFDEILFNGMEMAPANEKPPHY